jgi:hypothetical protein
MNLTELINNVDILKIDSEYYQSTLCEACNIVNENNYEFLISEANEQIKLLLDNEKLHGFFIVDWRVNFANLYQFVQDFIQASMWDRNTKEFMEVYNDKSAQILYKRLGLDY